MGKMSRLPWVMCWDGQGWVLCLLKHAHKKIHVDVTKTSVPYIPHVGGDIGEAGAVYFGGHVNWIVQLDSS